MKLMAPKIDERTFDKLWKQMRAKIPFYTPEWSPTYEQEAGQALLKIYLHMLEEVIVRLNQVPEKNFIAFLDMLDTKMLPAQSARAAVTFVLAEGTRQQVIIPKGTQLAGKGLDEEEVIFQTQAELRATPWQIQEVFSIDAQEDQIFTHTQAFKEKKAFQLISGENQQERSLYLGHADLFDQKNPSEITIDFALAAGATGGILDISWEYWNGERWVELVNFKPDTAVPNDTTELLKKSGAMTLEKNHIGEIAPREFESFGIKESRWLRCRLKNQLAVINPIQLPEIRSIKINVRPIEPFPAELAFNNDIPLDVEPKKIEGVELAFPSGPIFGPNVNEIEIEIKAGEIHVGDFVKLDNNQDPAEVRKIIAETVNKITLDQNLQFTYDGSAKISLEPPKPGVELAFPAGPIFGPNVNEIEIEIKAGDIHIGDFVKLDNNQDPAEVRKITAETVNKITLDQNLQFVYDGSATINLVAPIKPFGELPLLFDTFYLASDEGFSNKGAKVTLAMECAWHPGDPGSYDTTPSAVLSWEYWNGKSWQLLEVDDRTGRFEKSGDVTFPCPADIEKATVNGEEKYWLRVRIIDGDYGRELIIIPKESGAEVDIKKGKIHYPIIGQLTISYKDQPKLPEHCFSLNNLDFQDHIKDLQDNQKTFTPFKLLPERFQSLFLGFNGQLQGGPISILFNLKEQILGPEEHPQIEWFYWNKNSKNWSQLNIEDGTEDLTQVGLLEFSVPNGFAELKLFNKELFWLKAEVVTGRFGEEDSEKGESVANKPEIKGIFPNTINALQAAIAEAEILGGSDLTANQTFQLLHPLVIWQEVFVTESTRPFEEERGEIIREEGDDAIKELKDETGDIIGYRVRWHEVDDFYDSKEKSRHYQVDKVQGIVRFGDGNHGMVPPLGADNIQANYRFGGGKNGNVPPGKINGLKDAIPFVSEVTNHIAADGGSETETLEEAMERGPKRLKNRERAVTREDFEALARNASREISRAKCLPNTDGNLKAALGQVTVLIVPATQVDDKPPTRLMINTVTDYLINQSANSLSSIDTTKIHVRGAEYIKISVETEVVPVSLEATARVEQEVLKALKRYIHPLTGGPRGDGWEFGKSICSSEILALLQGVKEVDFIKEMIVYKNGVRQSGNIEIDIFALPFSGDHKVSISL